MTRCSASMRSGRTHTKILESADGRALRCVNQPMPQGGWVATFEDITEQQKFEQERERHREFLNQIIDNVPAMIVVKDAVERKFVHANRAAEAFWGFSRKEAIGKTLRELFPQRQCRVSSTMPTPRRCSPPAAIVQETHPSAVLPGDQRLVTSKRHTIRDADGKPRFLVSVVEDVSERKRLERERDRDRAFLNQIIDNVPTPIVVRDMHDPALCPGQSGGLRAFWRVAGRDDRQDDIRRLPPRKRRFDRHARRAAFAIRRVDVFRRIPAADARHGLAVRDVKENSSSATATDSRNTCWA